MIKCLLIVVFLLTQSTAFSIEKKPDDGINQVVDSIKQKHNSQRGYAEGVYDWIVQHISYDYDQRDEIIRTKKGEDISPEKVFERKKGTCVDFAVLAREMFSRLKMECKVIYGCSKTEDSDLIAFDIIAGHAWNAILINGQWLFMDCTLGRSDKGTDLPFRSFFLLTPEQFSLTHYSFGSKQSFLPSHLEASEFIEFPIVHNYFEFYDQLPDLKGKISSVSETIKIRISQPDSLAFSYAKINDLEDTTPADVSSDPANPGVALVSIPPKGKFLLFISRLYPLEKNFSELVPILTYYVERK